MSDHTGGDHGGRDHTKRSRTIVIAILGGIAAVVVIALIVVFTRSGPAELDPKTPEGVVQQYSQAVVDGDIPAARAYLSPDIAESCERVDSGGGSMRVTLVDTVENADSARVTVNIATVYGSGPLGSSEYDNDGVFDLEKVAGDWVITLTPWELTVCAESGR